MTPRTPTQNSRAELPTPPKRPRALPAATQPAAGIGPGSGTATQAAGAAVRANSTHLTLPFGIGTLTLPDEKKLGFYAGLVGMAALGVIEWPIAGLLGLGHLLTDDRSNKALQSLGEALDEGA